MTAASSVSSAASPLAAGWPARPAVDDARCGSGWTGRSRTRTRRSRSAAYCSNSTMAIVWPMPGAALAEQLVQPEDRGQLGRGVGAAERRWPGPPGRPAAWRRGRRGRGSGLRSPCAGACRWPPELGAGDCPAFGRSMECSWNRPSRPTTPVTDAGERGRDLRRGRVDDRPGRGPAPAPTRAACRTPPRPPAAVPLTGSSDAPRLGRARRSAPRRAAPRTPGPPRPRLGPNSAAYCAAVR